jgi:hypothetical protein
MTATDLRRMLVPVVAAAVALPLLVAASPTAEGDDEGVLAIEIVSNRADLLSGGDVRVRLDLPAEADPDDLTVELGDEDVTDAFALRPNGRIEALLEDVEAGEHVLRARIGSGEAAEQVLSMHPNGGPVFSGPHVEPWECQPTAEDQLCNEAPRYVFRYRTIHGTWEDYDPDDPPSDVSTTTTDEGETVPFIVRHEVGYQNRDQYRIAVLYDPEQPWEAWNPQDAWNHKVLITHGSSCGTTYSAGSAPDVEGDTVLGDSPTEALSRGFAVMSTALNHAGHNCNLVTQAESLVMAKERIVERYGDIRYTIGTGCSGGSLTQQQVANAYPGIYQGILPACSFPDAWSTGQQLIDLFGLNRYLHDPSRWAPGVVWDPLSIAAVEGHPNHVNSVVFESVYWNDLGNPTSGCSDVPSERRYHPQDNPDGVRCTLMDYMVNVLGPREPDVWSPVEREVGHGFAGIPLDNVGVQYGLQALEDGRITPAQFVDLNVEAGGGDIDTGFTPERLEADQPALRNSYLSGAVNTANNLDQVAIIDLRGPDHGVFHDAYRSWTIRARLEREHGRFDNHVIWVGHAPLIGDPRFTTEALLAMDEWLEAVDADDRDAPLADRIADNRPGDLEDRCSQIPGVEAIELPGLGRVCEHEHVQSRYGTPRMVAGSGVETDVQKCRLRPHRRSDYYPVTFTDAQWEALDEVFADGVCDYSRPGVDQVGAVPWRTYQDDVDGEVVYGGQPLGRAPERSGVGWTSPAFSSWLDADSTDGTDADATDEVDGPPGGDGPGSGHDRAPDGPHGGDRGGDGPPGRDRAPEAGHGSSRSPRS